MNTFDFIADNACAGFIERKASGHADCERLFNEAYPQPSGAVSRFSMTWVIVGPGFVEMKQRFANSLPRYSDETGSAAIARHIEQWDGTPRAFLFFEKKKLELSSVFLTHDLRRVRVCTARGVINFDATKPPGPGATGLEAAIWKARQATTLRRVA